MAAVRISILQPFFALSRATGTNTNLRGGPQKTNFSATKRCCFSFLLFFKKTINTFFLQVKSFTTFCTKHNVKLPQVGDAGFLVSFFRSLNSLRSTISFF
jgi:hypothetical protein